MLLGYLNTIMPYRILQAGEDACLRIMVCKEKKREKKTCDIAADKLFCLGNHCLTWNITPTQTMLGYSLSFTCVVLLKPQSRLLTSVFFPFTLSGESQDHNVFSCKIRLIPNFDDHNVNAIKWCMIPWCRPKDWLYSAVRRSASWRLCPVTHVPCLLH